MNIQKSVVYEIKDWSGKKLNKKEVLNLKISENKANYLIHRALIKQQIENCQTTASTKTKSEVRGGGKKPWQQKGRGRARAGSIRSPLWRGGGVIFGPKPKSIKIKLNKKEWKLSFQSLLYNKRNSFLILDDFNNLLENKKTKILSEKLNTLLLKSKKNVLLIISEQENSLLLASRNLKEVKTIKVDSLNIKSILEAKKIILSIKSLNKIKEIYAI